MTNAPTNTPTLNTGAPPSGPAENLGDRVDQLLSDIGAASERLEKSLDPDAGEPPAPANGAATADPAPQEAPTEATSPGASTPEAAPDPEPVVEDLLSQVDTLLRDAAGETPPEPATESKAPLAIPENVPPAKPEEIKSLDDQLATLTDKMIDEAGGAFAPESGTPAVNVADPAPPAAKPAAPEAASHPAPSASEEMSGFGTSFPAPKKPPVPPKEPAPTTSAASAPTTVPDPKAGVTAPLVFEAAPRAGVWEAVEPIVLRVLGAISAPLRGQPESVRQTLGWAAVTTVFTAAILWIVMALRPPPKPVEHDQAFDFVHGTAPGVPRVEEPESAAAGGEHGASGGSHGGEGAKGGAKKPTKTTNRAAKAKASGVNPKDKPKSEGHGSPH